MGAVCALSLLLGVVAVSGVSRGNALAPLALGYLPFALTNKGSQPQNITECPTETEFLCADRRTCIDTALRCNGARDCRDGSDELNCTSLPDAEEQKAVCVAPHLWCATTRMCMPADWRCDNEVDCPDGSDEANCTLTCRDGFLCADFSSCLHSDWQCDGERDCLDGSDELNCTGPAVCRPGQFACRNTSTSSGHGLSCVDGALVCDGSPHCPDASDEGFGCSRRDLCQRVRCGAGQLCRPTPTGGHLCLCPPGFTMTVEQLCRPQLPCEPTDGCEHVCEIAGADSFCTCPAGYQLATDNRTCALDAAQPEPSLLFTAGRSVRQLRLTSRQLAGLVPDRGEQVLAVAYDLNRRQLYWSFLTESGMAGVKRRTVLQNAQTQVFELNGSDLISALAWDWVAKVLYMADSGRRLLVACNWERNCALVTTSDWQPSSVAVHPAERALFWSELGPNGGRIRRAGLDGSERKDLITADLHSPGALSVDPAAGRIYWADPGEDRIASANLDGSDRRNVPEILFKSPYSLTVLGGMLFWSDTESEEIHSCDKNTGKHRQVVQKNEGHRSFHLLASHASLQPDGLDNPCARASCAHLCLLSPSAAAGYRCFCPPEMKLGRDGFTCHLANASALVVATSDLILSVSTNILGGPGISELGDFKPRLLTALTVDYLPDLGTGALSKTLLYADSAERKIYAYDLESRQRRPLVDGHMSNVVGVAVDPVRGNVYWADSIRRVIEVIRYDGLYRRVIAENQHFLAHLTISLRQGKLYLALGGRGAIFVVGLDGKNKQPLVTDDLQEPVSLSADDTTGRLFWADKGRNTIESVRYDGTDRETYKRHISSPLSLAVGPDMVYWTDMYSWELHMAGKDQPERHATQPVMDMDLGDSDPRPLLRLTFSSADRLPQLKELRTSSRCSRCRELCLPAQDAVDRCECGTGRQLASDGRSCLHAACAGRQFRCNDGACIQAGWRCDRRPDCADGEDEIGCDRWRPVTCRPDDYRCVQSGECLPQADVCDGTRECQDGSDEQDCERHECDASEFVCRSGACIPASWACDNDLDCTDGSDEVGCNRLPCLQDEFRCQDGRCIDAALYCDGRADCQDVSDEPAGCHRNTSTVCPPEGRLCRDGGCISELLWCDGTPDCPDGSDETPSCPPAVRRPEPRRPTPSCPEHQFSCGGELPLCLSRAALCDGREDCPEGEDELNCSSVICPGGGNPIPNVWLCDMELDCADGWDESSATCVNRSRYTTPAPPADTPCSADQYLCANGRQCIPQAQLCDGLSQCEDRSDEGGMCESACNFKICQGRCQPSPFGPICSCQHGLRLHTDAKTCLDIDECAENSPCHYVCNNTRGGYKCLCPPGYSLFKDGHTCRATHTTPWLLVTSGSSVKLSKLGYSSLELIYRDYNRTITHADFDSWTDVLYFYDSFQGQVLAKKRASPSPPRTVIKNVTDVTAMAFDWTTKNIYLAFQDGKDGVLRVCNQREECRTLSRQPGERLHALSLVPERGQLFACAQNLIRMHGRLHRVHSVLRMNTDGTGRKTVTDHKVGCRGIDFDRITGRVWWSGYYFNSLSSARPDGSDQRKIPDPDLVMPTRLVMFEDWAYVVSRRSVVRRCHTHLGRRPGQDRLVHLDVASQPFCETVYNISMRLDDISVVHRLRQPPLMGLQDSTMSVCQDHGRCAHLCLSRAGQVACYCPDNQPDCQRTPTAAAQRPTVPPPGPNSGPRGLTIAIVVCLVALLLAAVGLWYRRKQQRLVNGPGFHHQFNNPTYGMSPADTNIEIGSNSPWLQRADHDSNNNDSSKNRPEDGKQPDQHIYNSAHPDGAKDKEGQQRHQRQLGFGANSQDSGFMDLGYGGFSSTEHLVQ